MDESKPRHEALTYIANHREKMRYASVRARGLPIGSGSVESVYKQLVSMRMRRSGQRWRRAGAQSILSLRSLPLSERWEAAMALVPGGNPRSLTGAAIALQDHGASPGAASWSGARPAHPDPSFGFVRARRRIT